MHPATLHGVGVITKLYFAIFAAFLESTTLNLAQRSFKVSPVVTLYELLAVKFYDHWSHEEETRTKFACKLKIGRLEIILQTVTLLRCIILTRVRRHDESEVKRQSSVLDGTDFAAFWTDNSMELHVEQPLTRKNRVIFAMK